MPRRPFRGRVVSQKRQSTWVAQADQVTVNVASGGSAIIASFDAAAAGALRPTVVRSRGEVMIKPQAYTADLVVSGAFGICVVSEEAFAAGAASIPRPFDDSNWGGWFVWQSFVRTLEFVDASGFDAQAAWNWQVDSKAMRKIGSNDIIVMMAESQQAAFAIAMHVRLLLKLS